MDIWFTQQYKYLIHQLLIKNFKVQVGLSKHLMTCRQGE